MGRADKGLFITTGTFTPAAVKEATRDGAPPIDLLDGNGFAEKLKELRIGFQQRQSKSTQSMRRGFQIFELRGYAQGVPVQRAGHGAAARRCLPRPDLQGFVQRLRDFKIPTGEGILKRRCQRDDSWLACSVKSFSIVCMGKNNRFTVSGNAIKPNSL